MSRAHDPIQPVDIVWAEVVLEDGCDYARPCIVLDVYLNGEVLLHPCSGNRGLYKDGAGHLTFDPQDPEFAATKLPGWTYAIGGEDPLALGRAAIKRRAGRLTGDFLTRFREWYGLD